MVKRSALEGRNLRPKRFQAAGYRLRMGEMEAVTVLMPVGDVVSLYGDDIISRRDYELLGSKPGNRTVTPKHVERIRKGIRRRPDKLLLGSFVLAVDPGTRSRPNVFIDVIEEIPFNGGSYELIEFTLYTNTKLDILDAQHRIRALREEWEATLADADDGDPEAAHRAQLLAQSAVPVIIVFESDRDEISRMFVNMASTKPIPPSLVAVMDTETLPNRFGKAVSVRVQLLADAERAAARLAYLKNAPSKELLYSAAAMRGAACGMLIGFRDRSPEQRDSHLQRALELVGTHLGSDDPDEWFDAAVDEVVSIFDYAYDRLPGWKELKRDAEHPGLTPPEFRAQYVHGSAGGLYVFSGVMAAGRAAGLDWKLVIDHLAELPWAKNALRKVRGADAYHHPVFEDTLVITEEAEDEHGNIEWVAKTGGGNRTSYEKATRAVLHWLAKRDPALAEMVSPETLGEIGLAPRPGERRGRPRKN